MEMWYSLLLLLLLFLSLSSLGNSSESCLEKGFSSNLLCESCDELKRFNLEAISDDCNQCCQKSSSDTKV